MGKQGRGVSTVKTRYCCAFEWKQPWNQALPSTRVQATPHWPPELVAFLVLPSILEADENRPGKRGVVGSIATDWHLADVQACWLTPTIPAEEGDKLFPPQVK